MESQDQVIAPPPAVKYNQPDGEVQIDSGHTELQPTSRRTIDGEVTTGTGTPANDTTTSVDVTQPQQKVEDTNAEEIKDYRSNAIIVMAMFCVPIGIIAYMKANKSMKYLSEGNYEAARTVSQQAKHWVYAGLTCGAIIFIAGSIFVIAMKVKYS